MIDCYKRGRPIQFCNYKTFNLCVVWHQLQYIQTLDRVKIKRGKIIMERQRCITLMDTSGAPYGVGKNVKL